MSDNSLKEALCRVKVLAFDVDGTLTDSIGQIITCFKRTFVNAGLDEPSAEAVKGTIGMSLQKGIQSLLPDPSDEHLGAEITQLYRDTFTVSKDIHETRLFAGVADLILKAEKKGFVLAVASGKSRVGVNRFLNDVPEIKDCFHIVCTGDMTESKPHPAMLQLIAAKAGVSTKEIMMVGDAAFDIDMGHNAGSRTLGVLTGVCDRKSMEDLHPDFMLDRVTDLSSYL